MSDKYIYLYELALKGVDEELTRLRRIEDKSLKVIPALTLLVGLSTILLKWVLETPLDDYLKSIFALFLVAIQASILFCWILCIRVVKAAQHPTFSANDNVQNFFKKHNDATVLFGMTRSLREAAVQIRDIANLKSSRFNKAYRTTGIIGVLLLLSSGLITVSIAKSIQNHIPHTEQETVMNNNDDSPFLVNDINTPEQSDNADEEVDFEVEPPIMDIVCEGYDPIVGDVDYPTKKKQH